MNRLDATRRSQVIRCLVEGSSINSTVRMTGVAKNTVLKLLVEIGSACSAYLDATMRNLKCERLQADEAWSFCYAKQRNVTPEMAEERIAGDVWVWVAIDADTKLIPSWLLGKRDGGCATEFIQDLAGRLANRVLLTTDGLKVYMNAVYDSFGEDIDYGILHKIYGAEQTGEARYSPAKCIGCDKKTGIGSPDPDHISTSYIERQNLTMRMSMRTFTRLTNGFSKKIENHSASVALYMMYYNFGRKHTTLGTTPAVKAGLADHIWSVEEIVGLLEKSEPKSTRAADGDFKLNHYPRFATRDPELADAHQLLADLFMAKGQTQAALALGSALAMTGDVAGARPHLQKAAAAPDTAVREGSADPAPTRKPPLA